MTNQVKLTLFMTISKLSRLLDNSRLNSPTACSMWDIVIRFGRWCRIQRLKIRKMNWKTLRPMGMLHSLEMSKMEWRLRRWIKNRKKVKACTSSMQCKRRELMSRRLIRRRSPPAHSSHNPASRNNKKASVVWGSIERALIIGTRTPIWKALWIKWQANTPFIKTAKSTLWIWRSKSSRLAKSIQIDES